MTCKVLIIEDELVLGLLFQQALIRDLQDASVDTARDGAVGIKIAREWQPDVIILDIMLPGDNGWEVAKALKGDPTTAHIPIIAASGAGSPFDKDKPVIDPALIADYLRKPFDVELLCESIKKIIHGTKSAE
ncbi:MAG: response regulator [Spartobacteria bacterium]|nr:response regulator [Spartobacteria bacterium]